jgi:hypothetical protein
MNIRRFAPIVALAMIALSAASSPATAQPSSSAGQLSLWVGQWTYSGQTFETAYTHAHRTAGTDDCTWMHNRGYLVCDFLNTAPTPTTNNLSIFSFSPKFGTYTHLGVTKDFKPLWEKVSVQGRTWITPLELPYKGKTILYRDVYTFLSPDKQTILNEISADKGEHWIVISKGTQVRAR